MPDLRYTVDGKPWDVDTNDARIFELTYPNAKLVRGVNISTTQKPTVSGPTDEELTTSGIIKSSASQLARGILNFKKGIESFPEMLVYSVAETYLGADTEVEKKALHYAIKKLHDAVPGNIDEERYKKSLKTLGDNILKHENETISEDLREGKYFRAGVRAIGGALESAPSIVAAFTGYGGIAALGVSVAGNKFDEEFKEDPTRGTGRLMVNAIGSGAIEASFELVTRGIIRRAFGLAKAGNVKGARELISGGATTLVKNLGYSFGGEAASEAATELTSLMWDSIPKEYGGLGEKINWERAKYQIFDAGIIGSLVGGTISTFGEVSKKSQGAEDRAINMLLDHESKININKHASNINALQRDLPKADETGKKTILEEINNELNNIVDIKRKVKQNLTNLTKQELKNYATNIEDINRYRSIMLDGLRTDSEKKIASNKLNLAIESNNSILKDSIKRGFIETAEIVEKQAKYYAQQSGVDGSVTQVTSTDIAEAQLEKLAELQAEIDINEVVLNEKGKDSDQGKIAEENLKFWKEELDNIQNADTQFGFIKQDSKGNFEIFLNKDKPMIGSAAHEFLHKVLFKTLQQNQQIQDSMGNALTEYMNDKKGGVTPAFINRMGAYINPKTGERAGNFGEETITVMSESILDNSLPYNEGLMTKIGDAIRRFSQETLGTEIKFDTGRDVYNFIKDYNDSIKKRYVSKAITRVAVKGAEGKLVEGKKKAPVTPKTQMSKDNKGVVDDLGQMFTKETWDGKFGDFDSGADFAIDEIVKNGYFDQLIAAKLKVARSVEETNKFVKKVYSELTPHIKNFNPDENDSLFGWINTQVGNKATAVYNREKTPDVLKKAKRVEDKTKEGEPVVQVAAEETTTEFDEVLPVSKSEKARVLQKLSDVELENSGEIDAIMVAEVESLIEEDASNMQEKLDKIVIKYFTKRISDDMGKISKVKGETVVSEEYKAFHALGFGQIIAGLDLNTIKKNYGKLFKIKKSRREKDKKVDPVTGKVTYPGKGIFEVVIPKKAEWTKYFTEGGYTTLLERRRALAKILAKSKTDDAVDTYIERNSNNIDAVTDAKLRLMSNTAQRQKNEQKSFDTITYFSKVQKEFNKEKKKGTHANNGTASEQATTNVLMGYNIPGLVVLTKQATEKDGMADVSIGVNVGGTSFIEINVEQKLDILKSRLHQKLVTKYDFINDILSVKEEDIKSYSQTKVFNKAKSQIKDYYNRANELIIEFNKGRLTGKKPKLPVPQMQTSNDFMPEPVQQRLLKEKLVTPIRKESRTKLIQDEKGGIVSEHYANKKYPSDHIQDFDNSQLHALGEDIMFNGKIPSLELEIDLEVQMSKFSEAKSKAKATKGKYIRSEKYGVKMVQSKPRFSAEGRKNNSKKSNYSLLNESSMRELIEPLSNVTEIINPDTKMHVDLSRVIQQSRPTQTYFSKSRGMSTFDFDETLIIEGKNFITATNPNTKEEIKISSENWPLQGPKLAEEGYTFDFSDFINVRGGIKGPLFVKLKNQIKKFGPDNVFILTARPAESAQAIHGWLKSKGIDLPLKNITGLGDSTGEAKAMWMLEKFSEGYNDMYFVDDALPNVKAVKNALDQLDIKSNIQQARTQFSKDMDTEFNSILEDVAGIDAKKRFSAAKAKKRGEGKGRFRIFIPPSHEDFVGLLYNFMGKGEKGNKHRNFFEQALVKPLNRAFTELNAAKQAISNDYRNLIKKFPDTRKKLTKKTPDGDYLYSDAVRVYLWDKFGIDIPGMSKTDIKELTDLINKNPDLKTFADAVGIISRQKDGYVKPGQEWQVGDIRTDLADATLGVGRKQFFTEFIENSEIIFSKENLNKIEAVYGENFREALEEILYKIKNGRAKPTGNNRLVNRFTEWINGSVGSTMFINPRSAILQQLSIVNFINYADNNVFKAAAAFANQPQYWKDYATIFNSDFLKQRRAGIAFDVNGAELAQAVSKSKEPFRAAIRYLLQKGFILTQLGDSNAIAIGGATFYRNRVNTYLKQGLTQKEAESKAWTDFTETAEMTQQSARPDMVSQQQSSVLGKFVLAFQNVTSQYNRLIKKAGLDLINRRKSGPYKTQWQSDMSNISRIMYYGAIQNFIFYGLQTALFAMMFDDEERDEEFFEKKRDRIINGSIDSILRGMGVGGAIISTLKNAAMKIAANQKKKWSPSTDILVSELLQLSPPIGIKARKLTSAEKTMKYNKKVIKEMETFDFNNPIWEATSNVVEGTTNLPTNRMHRLTTNTQEALDSRNAWWQRLALLLGWNKWELGVKNEEIEAVKKEIKENNKKIKKKSQKKKKKKKTTFKTKTFKTKTF